MTPGERVRISRQAREPASPRGITAPTVSRAPDDCEHLVSDWVQLKCEASAIARREPLLTHQLDGLVLRQACFADALAALFADKLKNERTSECALFELAREAIATEPAIAEAALADLHAVRERDPAAGRLIAPFLHFKGYQALQAYRVAHWLWQQGRADIALHLQSRTSECFAIDIHPAARLGRGIMIDHGHGVVIGETAVVADDVSMLHGVTLGGTGKERGDRHPKVRSGVVLGADVKVLGNIVLGEGSQVGAGSVVLEDVPPGCTVAGVPARVVSQRWPDSPARHRRHTLPENKD